MKRMSTCQSLATAVAGDVAISAALTASHAPVSMTWALIAMTGLTAAGTIAAHHNEQHN